jgi:uncharacterized membrane protein YhaH (DUF805 family)
MKYLHLAIKDCFNYNGRMSRRAYWMFTFQAAILNIILFFFLGLIFFNNEPVFDGLIILIEVAFIFPFISAYIRRLHDINYEGWWVVLSFIPFFLLIFIEDGSLSIFFKTLAWVVYFFCIITALGLSLRHGTYEENDYGEVPINELDKVSSKKYSENVSEELRRYKKLFDDGIISEEEFVQKKKEILNL